MTKFFFDNILSFLMTSYKFKVSCEDKTEIIESNRNIFTYMDFKQLLHSKVSTILPSVYEIAVGLYKWNSESTLTLENRAEINIISLHNPA